jgi:pyruvate dehydrogenase E2 component (dihydrolipoamide acetyltransferase)
MAVSVVMPALEMAQDTGKLLSWRKKEGEQVRKGEPLLDIETDKAVVEVEAPGDGILSAVTAREGAVIPVGHTIAWLLRPGESVPNASLRVSPKARRLAKERGIDLATIKGSGPDGEIVAEDIPTRGAESPAPQPDRGAESRAPQPDRGAESRAPQPDRGAESRAPQPDDVARPFQGRDRPAANSGPAPTTAARLMAERTTHGWTTVPHFFLSREVDATALNAMREAMSGVTHTDLLVALVARALKKHPRMNGGSADVNVAIAIAVDDAVVTGVIHRADASSLAAIASRRKELTERARAGKLQPADIAGATFTISNLGMFQVDAFTAIIVPPQAGILAVGAIADRVVAVNGQPAVRAMMTLTLSCDHRVVDGARGAAFLNDVVEAISAG